jgi:hypothetical protein
MPRYGLFPFDIRTLGLPNPGCPHAFASSHAINSSIAAAPGINGSAQFIDQSKKALLLLMEQMLERFDLMLIHFHELDAYSLNIEVNSPRDTSNYLSV